VRHTCRTSFDTAPLIHSLWLVLHEPIYLTPAVTVAMYIHCPSHWGALCYRMIDDTGCQVAPGIETTVNEHITVRTGTFTQSPQPFEDVDGCVCAFAGRVEYEEYEELSQNTAYRAQNTAYSGVCLDFARPTPRLPPAYIAAPGRSSNTPEDTCDLEMHSRLAQHDGFKGSGALDGGWGGGGGGERPAGPVAPLCPPPVCASSCKDCRWADGVWFFDCGQHAGV